MVPWISGTRAGQIDTPSLGRSMSRSISRNSTRQVLLILPPGWTCEKLDVTDISSNTELDYEKKKRGGGNSLVWPSLVLVCTGSVIPQAFVARLMTVDLPT